MADKQQAENHQALLVLTFGGPEKPADVMPFLLNVTAGRNVPQERLAVVAEQYTLFGGRSPINDLSRDLVAALETELGNFDHDLPVYWGTRNWVPHLVDTVQQMADDGIETALVFTDSPYSSYSGCRQYQEDLDAASATVAERGATPPSFTRCRAFFNHPGFIEPMAQNTMAAIHEHHSDPASSTSAVRASSVRIVFTAHSIPLGMAAACDYEQQLAEATALVIDRLGPSGPTEYDLVFQSRSGPPQVPWLEPDICDHLRTLDPAQRVTIVPIGFTQDHTEVLYDLDTQAVEVAANLGLSITRAKTVGSHHMYIKMIRELLEEQLCGEQPLSLGAMGPCVAHTGPDHCLSGGRPSGGRPSGGKPKPKE